MKLQDVHDFFDFVWFTWLPLVLLGGLTLGMGLAGCIGPR